MLDRKAFLEWRDQHGYDQFDLPQGRLAELADFALVYEFPSRWWGGRVAGLAPSPGARVYGRLFEIAAIDWPIVEHKEGAITGMCAELKIAVRVDGEELEAYAFTTRPERRSLEGPVSTRFVEALVSGAASAALPEAYVASLRGSAR